MSWELGRGKLVEGGMEGCRGRVIQAGEEHVRGPGDKREHRISRELQMGHVAEAWTKGRKRRGVAGVGGRQAA